MLSLLSTSPYSNNARVELTRESIELEERLKPITAEMNEKPLRVNKVTWQINLEAAEMEASLLVDYCRQLSHDSSFRPGSPADCARALFEKRGLKPLRLSKRTGKPLTDKDTLSALSIEGDSLAGGVIDAGKLL